MLANQLLAIDYANEGDNSKDKKTFDDARSVFVKGNLGQADPNKGIDIVNRLFVTDEQLNQAHSMQVRHRAWFLLELVGTYAKMGHLYEDRFVGDTLREAGIMISALSPAKWIPAVGNHWWTINPNWDGGECKLLSHRAEACADIDTIEKEIFV